MQGHRSSRGRPTQRCTWPRSHQSNEACRRRFAPVFDGHFDARRSRVHRRSIPWSEPFNQRRHMDRAGTRFRRTSGYASSIDVHRILPACTLVSSVAPRGIDLPEIPTATVCAFCRCRKYRAVLTDGATGRSRCPSAAATPAAATPAFAAGGPASASASAARRLNACTVVQLPEPGPAPMDLDDLGLLLL
jgi:hypothetical protein